MDAPKGKNCADGWVLLARAVLSKVREMADGDGYGSGSGDGSIVVEK